MNEAANPLLMKRLNKVYSAALKKALADQKQFLRKV